MGRGGGFFLGSNLRMKWRMIVGFLLSVYLTKHCFFFCFFYSQWRQRTIDDDDDNNHI